MRRAILVALSAGLALVSVAGILAVDLFGKPKDEPRRPDKGAAIVQASRSESASRLPVARVVLFNSGVGYFQREGDVEGETRVDLSFPVTDINDLLKSLVVQDLGGGQVSAISLDSQAPVEKTLRSFAIDLSSNPSLAQILDQARGEKVEAVLQQSATSQPGTLTGAIVGVEKQKVPVGKDGFVEVEQLNMWCAEGLRQVKLSDLQRLRFLNPILNNEFKKALEVVTLGHDTQKKAVSFNFSGQGKRSVRVGYVVENPIWKTSYRLVLNKESKPFLQGWAVVENTTDEDWNGVKMALVSGRPISFKMDLYQPLHVPRPTVEPELFASLRPQAYSGAMSRTVLIDRESLGIAGKLSVGRRAVRVRVDSESLSGGFVLPHSRVDIVCVVRGETPKLICENILVTSIDATESKGEGRPTLHDGTATLEADPDDAEKLAYAMAIGEIRLLPRGPAGMVGKPGLDGASLGNGTYTYARQQEQAKEALDISHGVQTLAQTRILGNAFEYDIDRPVSLARQKSSLLPILNQSIEGTRVSIYNERVHAKFPLLGIKLKNTADVPLTQGPITVFDGSTYAGDGRIQDLQPKEERLMSYAIDLGTEVQAVPHPDNGRLTSVKIVKGVVFTTTKVKESKTYTVVNRSEQDRLVLLEHPFRPEFKLTSAEKPAETASDVYRFQVSVPKGKTVKQEVAEERTINESVALTNFDDNRIRFFINETVSSPKVKEALRVALEKRGQLATTQQQIADVQRELNAIKVDQPRLRSNLEKIPGTDPLAKRILEKLNKQETEIEQYEEQVKKLNTKADEQRKDYEGYLTKLDVE